MRTDQTETLSVIGHVIGIQLGKSIENIFFAHGLGVVTDIVVRRRFGQSFDNQFIGFASQRISSGVGDNPAFVNADFQFVQRIDPIAGIEILQFAFDRRMVQRHHRNQSVAGFLRGRTFTDFLKDGGGAFDVVFAADGVSQFRAVLLIGQMNVGFKLFDKRFANLC